jgi:hypothetical protein
LPDHLSDPGQDERIMLERLFKTSFPPAPKINRTTIYDFKGFSSATVEQVGA